MPRQTMPIGTLEGSKGISEPRVLGLGASPGSLVGSPAIANDGCLFLSPVEAMSPAAQDKQALCIRTGFSFESNPMGDSVHEKRLVIFDSSGARMEVGLIGDVEVVGNGLS